MSELILEVKGHYDNRYKTIFLGPIEDPNLSLKAKGLLTYLRTRPPDWEIRHQDLINRCKDGKAAVQTALKELEKAGYLYREQSREQNGRFTRVVYHVYEDPKRNPYFQKSLQNKDFLPQTDFRHADKREPDNRPLYQPTKVFSNNKQPTNQNQKVGWLAQNNQRGEESPLTPSQIDSYKLLVQKGVKPKVAKTLAQNHDLETITDVVESVCESGGVKNEPGLIVDRLNTIKETREKEREIELKREQAELQAEREREEEWERIKKQKEKEIAEFHQWQQSHPGGTWTQFALATT